MSKDSKIIKVPYGHTCKKTWQDERLANLVADLKPIEANFDELEKRTLAILLDEIREARRLLAMISYDFDPDKFLGPPCGPKMLNKIKDFEIRFDVDLRNYL